MTNSSMFSIAGQLSLVAYLPLSKHRFNMGESTGGVSLRRQIVPGVSPQTMDVHPQRSLASRFVQ